jgi:hypothetical protein
MRRRGRARNLPTAENQRSRAAPANPTSGLKLHSLACGSCSERAAAERGPREQNEAAHPRRGAAGCGEYLRGCLSSSGPRPRIGSRANARPAVRQPKHSRPRPVACPAATRRPLRELPQESWRERPGRYPGGYLPSASVRRDGANLASRRQLHPSWGRVPSCASACRPARPLS